MIGMSHVCLLLKRVGIEFGGSDPLVVVEPDFPGCDVEDELAIGAFVVFPAAMGFA